MCGRYELNETPARVGARYRIEPGDIEFAPNADVRPTTSNPVVFVHDGVRRMALRRCLETNWFGKQDGAE